MDLNYGERLIRRIMNHHGLVGWKLELWHGERWTLGKDELGLVVAHSVAHCYRGKLTISVSADIIEANSEEVIKDLTLHEIAHCFTLGDHTEVWSEWYRLLGGSGEIEPPGMVVPSHWSRQIFGVQAVVFEMPLSLPPIDLQEAE